MEQLLFDANAPIQAFDNARKLTLAEVARGKVSNALQGGDYNAGALAAFQGGDTQTGSNLMEIYMGQRKMQAAQEQAQAEAQQRQLLSQALQGYLPPELAGIAAIDGSMAVKLNNAKLMADAQRAKASDAPYTLSPGQRRFVGPNIVAEGGPPVARPPSATILKQKYETQESGAALDSAMQTLNEARSLLTSGNDANGNPVMTNDVLQGYGADAKAWAANNLPDAMVPDSVATPQQGLNTKNFQNIMSLEATKQMSELLKGATTDTEMARFTSILADPNAPNAIKLQTIDRMLKFAQQKKAISDARLKEMTAADAGVNPSQTDNSGADMANPFAGDPEFGQDVNGYNIGQVARNPSTGEVLFWDGNDWVR